MKRNKTFRKKGAKIGSKLRIRVPDMYSVTDYNPDAYDKQQLKKWCVEQALKCTKVDDNGNIVQVETIKIAEEIYNWVSK